MCGDSVRVYSNGKMEAPSPSDDKAEELPLLFCREVFVCNNTVEPQYYAAGDKPTKWERVQTKYVCCHCYSDGKLADNAYINEKRKNRGRKKYPGICKACVDDRANLVWNKKKQTNKLQAGRAKRKSKSDSRAKVREKRSKSDA